MVQGRILLEAIDQGILIVASRGTLLVANQGMLPVAVVVVMDNCYSFSII